MTRYIVSDPDILGGTPVVKGTRVPIARILFLLREGYTLEEVQLQYDHISMKMLEGVLDELSQAVEETHDAKTP